MKKKDCEKCGKYTYVENHHILPKSSFGENDEKAELCSNCHTEYHQELGNKNLKNDDMEFHLKFWYKWFYGAVILIIIFISIFGIIKLF